MRFTNIFLLVFIFSAVGTAQDVQANLTPEQALMNGISSMQKKDWKKAQELFAQGLASNPQNTALMHNLAVAHYQLGHMGLALGLWRKALALRPFQWSSFSALIKAEKVMSQKQFISNNNVFELLHRYVFRVVPVFFLGLVCLIMFYISGRGAIRYLAQRRKAVLEEQAFPGFPWFTSLANFILLFSLALLALKLNDAAQNRGTVLDAKLDLRSSPEPTANSIIELNEGNEVVVRQSQGSWLQIEHEAGMAGWVPKEKLLTLWDDE